MPEKFITPGEAERRFETEGFSYLPEERICKNCKHWDSEGTWIEDESEGDYRRCALAKRLSHSWMHNKYLGGAPIIYDENEGHTAICETRFDFGCNRWEAK